MQGRLDTYLVNNNRIYPNERQYVLEIEGIPESRVGSSNHCNWVSFLKEYPHLISNFDSQEPTKMNYLFQRWKMFEKEHSKFNEPEYLKVVTIEKISRNKDNYLNECFYYNFFNEAVHQNYGDNNTKLSDASLEQKRELSQKIDAMPSTLAGKAKKFIKNHWKALSVGAALVALAYMANTGAAPTISTEKSETTPTVNPGVKSGVNADVEVKPTNTSAVKGIVPEDEAAKANVKSNIAAGVKSGINADVEVKPTNTSAVKGIVPEDEAAKANVKAKPVSYSELDSETYEKLGNVAKTAMTQINNPINKSEVKYPDQKLTNELSKIKSENFKEALKNAEITNTTSGKLPNSAVTNAILNKTGVFTPHKTLAQNVAHKLEGKVPNVVTPKIISPSFPGGHHN